MNKTIVIVSLLLLTTLTYSQVVGEIELKEGQKIGMYAKVKKDGTVLDEIFSMHGQTIYYYNEKGRKKSINHSKIKKLITDSETYINLPIYSLGVKRLHKIVAENDKYLLTDYYSLSRFQFYIFDKKNMKAVEKLKFISYRQKKDAKLIGLLEKYFNDCPELMEKIQSNFNLFYGLSDKNSSLPPIHQPLSIFFWNISNYRCD